MHFKKRKGKREDRSQFTGLQFKLNKEKKYIFLVVWITSNILQIYIYICGHIYTYTQIFV